MVLRIENVADGRPVPKRDPSQCATFDLTARDYKGVILCERVSIGGRAMWNLYTGSLPTDVGTTPALAPVVDIFGGEADGPLSWQDRALCAQTDPEAFFPEKGGSTREAKKVCTSCEVRSECLDLSLIHISEPTRRTPISYA